MSRRGHLQLILHGAIILLIGMLVGIPGFPSTQKYTLMDEIRLFWRQAHLIPVVTGAWMIASGAALPHLKLTDRGESLLTWSLIVSGYAFPVSLLPWAYALFKLHVDVMKSSFVALYMLPLIITGIGALVGDLLIIRGAYTALRDKREPRLP